MITYCQPCGQYLGDTINGVLYKFGHIVTHPHACQPRLAGGINSSISDELTHMAAGCAPAALKNGRTLCCHAPQQPQMNNNEGLKSH